MTEQEQAVNVRAVLTVTLDDVLMDEVTNLYTQLSSIDVIRRAGNVNMRLGNGGSGVRLPLTRRP